MSNFEAKTAEEFRGEPTSEAAPGSKVPEADVGGLEFFGAGRFYTYSHDTPSQSANGMLGIARRDWLLLARGLTRSLRRTNARRAVRNWMSCSDATLDTSRYLTDHPLHPRAPCLALAQTMSAYGGKADSLAHLSACLLIARRRH